eukprot:scaffold4498_cov146-Skeletonema_menzelii.AAC.3
MSSPHLVSYHSDRKFDFYRWEFALLIVNERSLQLRSSGVCERAKRASLLLSCDRHGKTDYSRDIWHIAGRSCGIASRRKNLSLSITPYHPGRQMHAHRIHYLCKSLQARLETSVSPH